MAVKKDAPGRQFLFRQTEGLQASRTEEIFLKLLPKPVRRTKDLITLLIKGKEARREAADILTDPGGFPACPRKKRKAPHGKGTLIGDYQIGIASVI